MAPPDEANEKTKATIERRVTGGFSRAPPALEEREKESASSSDQISIKDLVEQQLGLRKSTHCEQNVDMSQDSSRLSQQSSSGIDHSLENASSSRSRTLANKHEGATHLGPEASGRGFPLHKKAQGDGYFKRPLGAAPRTRASQISTNGSVKHSQYKWDSKIQLGNVPPSRFSVSSPDLRTLKSVGRERQPPVAMTLWKSDEMLLVPQRDDTMNESQLLAREQFGLFRSTPKNAASQFNTAGSIQVHSNSSVSTDSVPWPEPKGLLIPVGLLELSRIDLGTISVGVAQNVVLALVNPTEKERCYQIQQLRSKIGGRAPKDFEMAVAEFPGQHTVAGGCVAKIQGSFLSLSPGAVEITVGLVAEDNAGGGHQNQPTITLVAQAEPPCIIREPSQTIPLEGVHLDAEQISATSRASQEVTIVTKGPTPCPP